jgi:hypothetical protein
LVTSAILHPVELRVGDGEVDEDLEEGGVAVESQDEVEVVDAAEDVEEVEDTGDLVLKSAWT